jgi:hypothetical protein
MQVLDSTAAPSAGCLPATAYKGIISRMALPSILSLAGARIPRAHAAIFSDLHHA